MSSDLWGAVAIATGMWVIGSINLIGSAGTVTPPNHVVWTASSSEKVASHPTLVRRSLPANPSPVRIAALVPPR